MSVVILRKTFPPPAFCETDIVRYAGCKQSDTATTELLQTCIREATDVFTYNVCYRDVPVTINDGDCDFGIFRLHSADLAQTLNGCETAVVFAATVGVGIDRLIAKYGRISPTKALLFQAIGTERIEALCDTFCADIEYERNIKLTSRFSPGYGDLPLTTQTDIFAVLNCEKQIGLTLTDSLLMSPSKSVTAIVGVHSK